MSNAKIFDPTKTSLKKVYINLWELEKYENAALGESLQINIFFNPNENLLSDYVETEIKMPAQKRPEPTAEVTPSQIRKLLTPYVKNSFRIKDELRAMFGESCDEE